MHIHPYSDHGIRPVVVQVLELIILRADCCHRLTPTPLLERSGRQKHPLLAPQHRAAYEHSVTPTDIPLSSPRSPTASKMSRLQDAGSLGHASTTRARSWSLQSNTKQGANPSCPTRASACLNSACSSRVRGSPPPRI